LKTPDYFEVKAFKKDVYKYFKISTTGREEILDFI